MRKTPTVIIAVTALVAGLVMGYAGGTLLGPAGAGKVRNANLQVGDKAPDFQLRDHTGRMIELGDYLGKKNVVLAFLPGAFTPI
jgi:cytochrome oxidase Cu insertion factor (SCO1/SenC/PrrC family)